MNKQFEGTLYASHMDEKEKARDEGLTRKEYLKKHQIPSLQMPVSDSVYKMENRSQAIVDFINRWERKNNEESQIKLEQLPSSIDVVNNSSIQEISHRLILSYVLRIACKEMKDNAFYKNNNLSIDKLSDVCKIEIKNAKRKDELKFSVYTEVKVNFRKLQKHISFNLDSNGQIILT